jgi:hypothetical protein
MGEVEIVYTSNAQRMAWMVDDNGSGVTGYCLLCKELAEADGSEGVEGHGGVRRIGASTRVGPGLRILQPVDCVRWAMVADRVYIP